MSNPLQQTIEALAKEKGIEPETVISAIEEAVATASRKYYKTGENLKTRFNTETGQVDLFAVKKVVQDVTDGAIEIGIDEARQMYRQLYGDDVANSIELGDEMEFPKATEVLGRIAAQTAKQVIFQKVREAERENIFAEYNQRIGEVVNGTVKRFENGDIILEIGRIEAVLPRKEQSRAESYAPADRIRTVIKGVNRSAKGPQIVLSRTDPALLIKLFEQEVPEIYDDIVLPAGGIYKFTEYQLQGSSADHRVVSIGGEISTGRFFSGRRREYGAEIGVRPMRGIALTFEAEHNVLDLAEGSFDTDVVRMRADTQFSPWLSVANNLQFDNVSRLLGWQMRARWIRRPGNDLYLVYTHNWREAFDVGEQRMATLDNRLATKLLYTFRF